MFQRQFKYNLESHVVECSREKLIHTVPETNMHYTLDQRYEGDARVRERERVRDSLNRCI